MNWRFQILISATALFTFLALTSTPMVAQEQKLLLDTDEQQGPFERLIIRGVTMIDGTGAPPSGPKDIVIEDDKIVDIVNIGSGTPFKDPSRPQEADYVIDARGMYITPGFIDTHTHGGEVPYIYKLWLGHGITTVRGVGTGGFDDLEWSLKQRELSAANKIVAPRLVVCARPGAGAEWREKHGPTTSAYDSQEFTTPEQIREWVRYAKEKGVQCVKMHPPRNPDVMAALLSEADSLGLPTVLHNDQMGVVRMSGRRAAMLGLDTMTHFYGLFESLLDEHTIQDFPVSYNYGNEYDRFSQVARLWNQIHPPGSEEWNELIDLFLKKDLIINPTFSVYVASRNLMSARNAMWHEEYTLPSLWEHFQPSPESHGSYFYRLTSADEAAWQNFYNVWMQFIDDYNDAGGRVTTGSDAGNIYQLNGFGYIQELKLLQEAGLLPLEVIRSATLYSAQEIFEPNESNGEPIKYGIIREGKKADLVLLDRNPLKDFNLLFGTGALRLNSETGELERLKAIKYTIKDGIVYDSQKLLEDVRQMVDTAESKAGWEVDMPPEQ